MFFLAEPTWITSIWEFLSTHRIQLRSSIRTVPEPPRHNDRFIMDLAMESGLSMAELGAINHCRLAQQALFLSDITTGWGDHICAHCTLPPKGSSFSTWQWPLERPAKADWPIWTQFLKNSVATSDFYLIH